MAENKTQQNDASVEAFLNTVEDEKKRADCFMLVQLMQEVTGEPPKMWGDAIIGFGKYHYKYESGREGEYFIAGFSPRKANITLYMITGFEDYDNLLEKLGKHKTGKSCLYINRLTDVNTDTLRELVKSSTEQARALYPDA